MSDILVLDYVECIVTVDWKGRETVPLKLYTVECETSLCECVWKLFW